MDFIRTNWIFGVGFLAQALFGLRILVQWWIAETSKHNVSPSAFWILSLAGSGIFLCYGILRQDIVIILGQLLSYFIYVRNLQLKRDWKSFPSVLRIAIIAIPIVAVFYSFRIFRYESLASSLFQNMSVFFIVGLTGQLLLNFRFIYQLYHSERSNESILPPGFWWLSMAGSILLVVYSLYRRDPVLLIAQGMALVPYVRNIILSKRSYDQHI